jgi:hypothetical protein
MTSHLPNYFCYWGKAKPGNDPPYHLLAFHRAKAFGCGLMLVQRIG